MRDLILKQMTRATDRRLGDLRVKLPTVRVWTSHDRTPRLTWERLVGGLWLACASSELTEEQLGDVRVYLRSDGWSADARVASIRHGVYDRMRVTLHDGRVL